MHYQANIDSHKAMLDQLLAAPTVRYADWAQIDKTVLRHAAGVYHFFEIVDGCARSIYVGKGSFGNSRDWSLCSRIYQHFRPSQKHTLLGKMSSATGMERDKCKVLLEQGDTYVQWITMCDRASKHDKLDAEILWFECFAISVLKPQYTDG